MQINEKAFRPVLNARLMHPKSYFTLERILVELDYNMSGCNVSFFLYDRLLSVES